MTCTIIPDFILKLFEKEIAKVVERVVVKMCDEYHIDVNDAKLKLKNSMDIDFDIVDEDIEQVKIVKKHNASTNKIENNSTSSNTNMCEARLYISSELSVRQCSRSKHENGRFCKTHQKQFDANSLKWGTIHDDKPDEISTAKLKNKTKKTLY
jgi:cellulose synthase/poly-beta-1,6-N-acetylglucosamine synthase-like glycosyltransferase